MSIFTGSLVVAKDPKPLMVMTGHEKQVTFGHDMWYNSESTWPHWPPPLHLGQSAIPCQKITNRKSS